MATGQTSTDLEQNGRDTNILSWYLGDDVILEPIENYGRLGKLLYALVNSLLNGTVFRYGGRVDTVGDLPESGTPNEFYLVGPEDSENYDEYIWVANEEEQHGGHWDRLGAISITIDDEFSSTSENPLQNKVISAGFTTIDGRITQVKAMLAQPYEGSGHVYSIGDYRINENVLYRCIANYTAGSTFDSSKWVSITLTDEIQRAFNAMVGKKYTYSSGGQTVNGGEIFNDYTNNTAIGANAHAEGNDTDATGTASHSEGYGTLAYGAYSHSEGKTNSANGEASHAEGQGSQAGGAHSHVEGYGTHTTVEAAGAHVEGYSTEATGAYAHAEGYDTNANAQGAHSEGGGATASGQYSHAEGGGTTASGASAHAEGGSTTASGPYSHAEGYQTTASALNAHAEGVSNTAAAVQSHAEGAGNNITSAATNAHAEGASNTVSGAQAHAEGGGNTASGDQSHVEGSGCTASAVNAHAQGAYTIAASANQMAMGKFNESDAGNKYAVIVGNGSDANNRSNAATVDWSGNAEFAGSVKMAGKKALIGTIIAEAYDDTATYNDGDYFTLDGELYVVDSTSGDYVPYGPNLVTAETFDTENGYKADDCYVTRGYPPAATGLYLSGWVTFEVGKTYRLSNHGATTNQWFGAYFVPNKAWNPQENFNYNWQNTVDFTASSASYTYGRFTGAIANQNVVSIRTLTAVKATKVTVMDEVDNVKDSIPDAVTVTNTGDVYIGTQLIRKVLTQAEYDLLDPPDPKVDYLIVPAST